MRKTFPLLISFSINLALVVRPAERSLIQPKVLIEKIELNNDCLKLLKSPAGDRIVSTVSVPCVLFSRLMTVC